MAVSSQESSPLGTVSDFALVSTDQLLQLLFPIRAREFLSSEEERASRERAIRDALLRALKTLGPARVKSPTEVVDHFFARLSTLHSMLEADAQAISGGDPAAKGNDEVVLCYPGFYAIAAYRFAHELYRLKVPLLPRMMTEAAHRSTGVDIHPGATIGRSFGMDHGTGVVIGETAILGDHVYLYQGVTLGGLVVKKQLQGTKRHPTLEDHVTVYANATILGGDTVIGAGSVIGGSVWLTSSVPAGSVVYHRASVTVRKYGKQNPLKLLYATLFRRD